MLRRTVLFAAFLCLGVTAFAQTTSLTGIVTDPSGAVIPAASITIVNLESGTQREETSDGQGRYNFALLPPGNYKLTARAAGFTEVVIERVELLVSQTATIPITFSKIGTTTTAVQVEATATQINTTDASLGNAINTHAIQEVPMYARNVAGLLALQPGVTSFSSFGGTPGSRDGAVNGGKPDQGNITLDGADVNDQNARTAFTSVLRVTLDSVEEFRSTTTNGDAATGRGSGADVTLVTKSGTNDYHGSLYEYRRGTETAANTFFNNSAGVPRAPLLINIFGGSLGAPIKKNKLFYFINYEGYRSRSSATQTRTVPTETLKQGIVEYIDKSGAVQQVTPAQMKALDPGGIGEDPAALKYLSLFPKGNYTALGDGLNMTGYLFNYPSPTDQNTYIAKLDYKIDEAGKHSLFVRGNLQNDSAYGGTTASAPQFPGLPDNQVILANSKGLAGGLTSVLTPALVNTFHYGFTRAGNQNTGVLAGPYTYFRGFDTPYGTSTGLARIIPVHTFGDDLSWNKGAHNIRAGAVVRLISNNSVSFANSYSHASSNPSVLAGSGSDLTGNLAISSGTLNSFEYAAAAALGVVATGTGAYNYKVDGTVIPAGQPVSRDFVNHEGELYVQDTWKATRNFTVTAGLRLSLEPPVYEANGQQASTNISIADWLSEREILASRGQSQNGVTPITFIPANGAGGRSMYPFHTNWAPRLGIAYSPKAESGLSKWLFGGPGKTSIRAGAGMYYDVIGQPLAQTINGSQFGLSSVLSTPPNVMTTAQAPRFTDFFTVPSSLVPPTPPGGLPVTYPAAFAITNSINDKLKAPYTMNLDFSIGRDFGHGFFIQASYVGRLSRHSLASEDLAEPTNLTDPKSGQTYFQAMTQLMNMMDYQGVTVPNLPKIPFFEDMWASAAGVNPVLGSLTATQVWGLDYQGYVAKGIKGNSNQGDATNTLNNADNASNCSTTGTKFKTTGAVQSMGCGIFGPWMMFNPQFSALSTWSSVGSGAYHALQLSVRKRYSNGLQFDVNYTFSKSMDLGSAQENGGSFSGVIINTFNLGEQRAVSNYDTTHQVNAYAIYQLPFGRGQKYGSNMNRILDAFVGGWQISGIYRQTSGLPFAPSDGSRWATNWEVSTGVEPNGNPIPPVVSTGHAIGESGPNLWANPAAAFAAFREAFAGEAGMRNTFRGDGLFNIDSGVFKSFTMPYSEHHRLQFRWEAFNLTNSVRFDPASASANLLSSSSFGKLTSTLTQPRQMQFALRYSF
jgi:hypothetical protein